MVVSSLADLAVDVVLVGKLDETSSKQIVARRLLRQCMETPKGEAPGEGMGPTPCVQWGEGLAMWMWSGSEAQLFGDRLARQRELGLSGKALTQKAGVWTC